MQEALREDVSLGAREWLQTHHVDQYLCELVAEMLLLRPANVAEFVTCWSAKRLADCSPAKVCSEDTPSRWV